MDVTKEQTQFLTLKCSKLAIAILFVFLFITLVLQGISKTGWNWKLKLIKEFCVTEQFCNNVATIDQVE